MERRSEELISIEGGCGMKRIKGKLYCFFVMALLLGACKKEAPVESQDAVIAHSVTYTNQGKFQINDQIIRFYDVQSGQDVALCAKPNCEHLGESSTNPSPECDAFFGSHTEMPAIVGGQLYCIVRGEFSWDKPEGLFQKYLYRAEVDGTNRKEIAYFPEAQNSAGGDYSEGYFVYTYANTEDVEGNPLEMRRAGAYVVDLTQEKAEQIVVFDGHQAYIPHVMIYNGKVYYERSYMTEYMDFSDFEQVSEPEFQEEMIENSRTEIWEYDIQTKEQSCIWSGGGRHNAIAMDDGIICINESGRVTIINCADGTQKEAEPELFNGKGIMPHEKTIYIMTDGVLQAYEIETEKLETVGHYDESKLPNMGIMAITEETVYFMIGNGEEYYLPYESFIDGKLDEVKKIEWQS